MRFSENFSLALSNIKSSKGRAFLTMLGIIIGISSVMVIIGLGNGMEQYMTDQFESIGTNILTVSITGEGTSKTFDVEDMEEIVAEHSDYLDKCTPTVPLGNNVKVGTEKLNRTSCKGVGTDFFDINGYTLAKGRLLRYMDIKERTHDCVIGSYLDDEWYGGDSIGKTIRIGGQVYTIVGVLEQEDDEPKEGGTDDAIYVPYTTAARAVHVAHVYSYTVTIVSEDKANDAVDVLENALFDKLRSEDAYTVISMSQILDIMDDMLNVVITVLAIIAGISLVVGGVGIMNIMLVSVSERTREIGIRKALGAKERYILSQFVIEAAVISAMGGVVGIAFGYGLSSLATVLVTALLDVELAVTPTLQSISLAFGASAAIGVVFGFLPARKAAALNPIDALRYE